MEKKRKRNRIIKIVTFSAIIAATFVFPASVYALDNPITTFLSEAGTDILRAIMVLISGALSALIAALGAFLSLMVNILQDIARYSDFGSQEQVIEGWKIVRDVVNSFFIVVLIIIALATIIRFPKEFDFRQTLPKFIVAAVLVNFSRTIALFGINFSSVIMRSFLDAIGSAMPAFLLGLRAPAYTAMSSASVGTLASVVNVEKSVYDYGALLVAQGFSVGILLLANFALAMFVIILVIRILALWILLILSPAAFFLLGVPGKGKEYFAKWKDQYFQQLIIGPVMTFFMYLIIFFFINNISADSPYGIEVTNKTGKGALATLISDSSQFVAFIIGIGLMFVTLEVLRQIDGKVVGFAQGLTNRGVGLLKRAARGIGRAGYGAVRVADDLAYSKNIPFLPTIRGAENIIKSAREGLAGKRQGLIEEGQARRTAKAQQLEGGSAGIRGLLYNMSAGNSEAVKQLNLLSGKSSLRARLGFTTGGIQDRSAARLDRDLDTVGKQNTARAELIGVGDKIGDDLGLMNLSSVGDLSAELANRQSDLANAEAANTRADELDADYARYQQLGELASEPGGATSEQEAEFNALAEKYATEGGGNRLSEYEEFQELQQIEDASGDQIARFQELAGEFDRPAAADVSALKQRVANAESLQQAVSSGDFAAGDIAEGAPISEVLAQVKEKQAAGKEAEKKILSELGSRRQRVTQAQSGLRQQLRERGKKYRDTAYEKDEKYGIEYISANAQGNFNASAIPEFSEDLLKAADQGALDDVLLQINPEYTMDDAGIAKFVADMKDPKKGGMQEQQALDLLNRLQGRNWKDKKAVQTGFVSMSTGGKFQLNPNRSKDIASLVSSNVKEVLLKGKKDAIAVKTDGKYQKIHPAALEGLKKEAKTVDLIIKDDRAIQSMDSVVRKLLLDQASEIGLAPASISKLESLQ